MIWLLMVILVACGGDALASSHRPLTKKDIDQMMVSLSNWGRWGKEDELGALNLITALKRKQAASLVKEGLTVSLAHNAIKTKEENSPPFEHRMIETGANSEISASDVYSVHYHGFTQTHLDALCHLFYKGKMYNGFSQSEVTNKGAARLSIINLKNGILTRGILVDLPHLFGVAYLKGAKSIHPEDLENWEKKIGVRIGSGDALLIRTGRWARRAAEGTWDVEQNSAGLDASCLPWLKKRDVALLGSDLATDVMPSGVEGVRLPVHQVAVIAMGVHILDNLDLEELSKTSAKLQRWEFQLTVAPLAVEGGTGSPVNPIAAF